MISDSIITTSEKRLMREGRMNRGQLSLRGRTWFLVPLDVAACRTLPELIADLDSYKVQSLQCSLSSGVCHSGLS